MTNLPIFPHHKAQRLASDGELIGKVQYSGEPSELYAYGKEFFEVFYDPKYGVVIRVEKADSDRLPLYLSSTDNQKIKEWWSF